MNQNPSSPPPVADNERLVAMLCYVSMVFIPFVYPIVVLLSRRRTHFQTYHAVQSLSLGVALGGIWICLGLLTVGYFLTIFWFGILLVLALICLGPLCWVASIASLFYYGYQAYKGEYARVPALYPLLESLGLLAQDPP